MFTALPQGHSYALQQRLDAVHIWSGLRRDQRPGRRSAPTLFVTAFRAVERSLAARRVAAAGTLDVPSLLGMNLVDTRTSDIGLP
jgi:hypothetical protein